MGGPSEKLSKMGFGKKSMFELSSHGLPGQDDGDNDGFGKAIKGKKLVKS